MTAVNKRILALVLGAAILAAVFICQKRPECVEVIVLMYHHVSDVGDGAVTVSREKLEADFSYISESGYSTVSVGELISFVDGGLPLPERVVCVVFDDGYESNYRLAFPLMKKYGIKAAVGVIGSSVGKCACTLPHFSWEQAAEMEASGLVTIISHTYGMHSEAADGRAVVAPLAGESDEKFGAAFRADHRQMTALMRSHLGHTPTAFAYPHGIWNYTAESVLSASGVGVTFISDAGVNTVVRGKPETLRLMKRYNVNETVDIREVLGR